MTELLEEIHKIFEDDWPEITWAREYNVIPHFVGTLSGSEIEMYVVYHTKENFILLKEKNRTDFLVPVDYSMRSDDAFLSFIEKIGLI